MPSTGFEPATPAVKRLQTYALDGRATWIRIVPTILTAIFYANHSVQHNVCKSAQLLIFMEYTCVYSTCQRYYCMCFFTPSPNQYDGLMAVRVLSCDMMLMQIARRLTHSSGPEWNKCSEQNTINTNYKLFPSTIKWCAPLVFNPVLGLL